MAVAPCCDLGDANHVFALFGDDGPFHVGHKGVSFGAGAPRHEVSPSIERKNLSSVFDADGTLVAAGKQWEVTGKEPTPNFG